MLFSIELQKKNPAEAGRLKIKETSS